MHPPVHLFLFQKLAASDLVDSNLHLLVKLSLFGQQTIHSLHDQVAGAAAAACGQMRKFLRLLLGKLISPILTVGKFHLPVNRSPVNRGLERSLPPLRSRTGSKDGHA